MGCWRERRVQQSSARWTRRARATFTATLQRNRDFLTNNTSDNTCKNKARPSASMASKSDQPAGKRQKRGRVSLYDAVAGRAGYEGFLTDHAPSKHRDTVSSTTKAVPPEEVLFRRKGAPVRYEEDDVYAADRHLRPDQRLPDSDLLKALHAYASDYYSVLAGEDIVDFRSLDETALLALGILVEEAAKAALGESAHLALVESSDGGGSSDEDARSGDGGSG